MHKFKSPSKANILVVDDDQAMRDLLSSILETQYDVTVSKCFHEAKQNLSQMDYDLVLLDIMLGDGNGMDLLKEIKSKSETCEVIMITVVKEIKTAVEAMKKGAFYYINKNFDYNELHLLIERALQNRKLQQEVILLREEMKDKYSKEFLNSACPKVNEIESKIKDIADVSSTVILYGESGTGKEVFARRIHVESLFKEEAKEFKPFISFNLASVPDELLESTLFGHEKGAFTGAHKQHRGKFELAQGGTLFLDEVGEMKLSLQAKILRVLQEREFERVGGETTLRTDARLIVATNRDLKQMVEEGVFREDLYYRLNVIPFHLPPLRDRKEDIVHLVDHFVQKFNLALNKQIQYVDPQVYACFQFHSWPGNIRELENVLERMIALSRGHSLLLKDVPLELQLFPQDKPQALDEVLKEANDTFEKALILRSLEKKKWNQVRTAKELGIHRKTLEYKIKKYALSEMISENKKLLKKKA